MVLQSLGPSQWSLLYGMLQDWFGTTWIPDWMTGQAGV